MHQKTLRPLILLLLLSPAALGVNCYNTLFYEPSPAQAVDPWGFFLQQAYINSIYIKTNGHVLQYQFSQFGDPNVRVIVDGNDEGFVSRNTAVEDAVSQCGYNILNTIEAVPRRKTLDAAPVQTSATTPVTGQANQDVAIGDFNHDGFTDSAALTSTGILVTLHKSDGTTLALATYPVPGIGASLAAADLNGDGILDLVATQSDPSGLGHIAVLLGKPDGTFGPPSLFTAGTYAFYLATGDFNGDGHIDIAATVQPSANSGAIAVLLGKGDGTFAAPVSYTVGQAPGTVVAVDFNGDGKLDLAALDDRTDITNKVWVLLGNGDGTFRPAISTPSGTISGYLEYVDLNHDGKMDLLIPDFSASAMVLMLGNGDGTFQPPNEYLAASQPISMGILPLLDGSTSIATVDNISGSLFNYFATSGGAINSPQLQRFGKNPSSVAAADLNGDKRPDLIVADPAAGAVYVALQNSQGLFANPVAYPVSPQVFAVAVGDVNHDGKPDVITAGNGIDVLLGKGDGTLASPMPFATSGSLTSVVLADFNSDGKLDIAAANASGGISVLLGNGDGTFQAARNISLPGGTVALAAVSGDVNGDGKPDLIATTNSGGFGKPGAIVVFLGKGDGTFQNGTSINLPSSVILQSLGVGDFNSDGKLDVVTAINGGAPNQIAVLLGKGDGTFGPPVLTPTKTAPPMLVVTDFNVDGKSDLILADCCGLVEASMMFGNGDGTFQPELQFPSGSDPKAIAAADFNADGRPDLAIVGQLEQISTGTLAVWFNNTSKAVNSATVVSAANAKGTAISPDSLAVAYGTDLAQGTPGSTSSPLPTSFGGTSVSLTDSTGMQFQAPLVYVSSTQVDFLVPNGVATGAAQVGITSGDGTNSIASVQVMTVAPGLFTLNASSLVAGSAIRLSADGTQTPEPLYALNSAGAVVAAPVNLGSSTDQVYLTLYGTGLEAAGVSGVQVTIGGVTVPVQYAGPQGQFPGFDQVNVILPHSLAGTGNTTIQLTADGVTANPVQITLQ